MLRAILEANASIGLWMQWLIAQTLQMTRAATSTGGDLDTWMGDFSLARQPASQAQGTATFSRLSASIVLFIPAGTVAKALVDNIGFTVVADTSHPAWQPANDSYIVPIGVASVDLPIVAMVAGAHGNVAAGSIAVLGSAVPGLDFVSNSYALSGGFDAESDAQFRARFRDYINSRSQATTAAVAYAIRSLQRNLRFKIFENRDSTGTWAPGHFLAIADDGTDLLTDTLRGNLYQVIDEVRPIGSTFAVRQAEIVPVNVAISLAAGGLTIDTATVGAIKNAISDYIDGLEIGSTLSVTRIIETAYRSGNPISNISSIAINSGTSDLVGSEYQIFRAQSVTVQ